MRKNLNHIILIYIPILLIFSSFKRVASVNVEVEVYFSPKGGCQEAVVKEIGKSKKSILVQAYIFTSSPIAESLVQAKERGVDIKIILDSSQLHCNSGKLDFLLSNDLEIYIHKPKGIAHNKVIIIDDNVVITGSYNFTKAAEFYNEENLLIFRNDKLTKIYKDNFFKSLRYSKIYESYSKKVAA